MPKIKTEHLISLVEWAEQNNVNMATARKYAQNGRLAGVRKVGKRWAVPITSPVPPPGLSGNPNFRLSITELAAREAAKAAPEAN